MLRAIDVANFFITLFENLEDDNDLTNMKINKLLYYSQGHCYERLGRPLFNDSIEAWVNGPVVNGVYQNLKQYDKCVIPSTIGDFDLTKFSDDESELLLDIAREYGKYSAGTLRNMTHIQGGPWDNYYVGAYHTVIPQDAIARHFMEGEKLSSFCLPEDVEVVGRVESDCLIISKEDFDDWDY